MIWLLLGASWANPLVDALVLEFQQDGYPDIANANTAVFEAQCADGQKLACLRDEWRSGDNANIVRAARVAAPLCEQGDAVSCLVVGWSATQVEPGKPDPASEDPAAGAKAIQTACDAGVSRACSDLATLYNKGVGVGDPAPDKALPLYRAACDDGVMAACRWVGTLFHAARGVSRDLEQANAYYQRACDGGLPGGCNNLGLAKQLGLGVPHDKPAAAGHYIAACQAGFRKACLNIDQLFAGGRLAEGADPALYEIGCALGSPFACHHHAETLRPKDPAKAAELFGGACTAGVVPSCSGLGRLYLSDALGDPDPARGAGLLEQACEGGDAVACDTVGRMRRDGDRIDADGPRAAELLELGCADGYVPACLALAEQYRKGIRIKKDKKAAVIIVERACELGHKDSCSP